MYLTQLMQVYNINPKPKINVVSIENNGSEPDVITNTWMACEKKKPCLVAEKTEKKSEVLENMENPDEALSFESLLLTQNDEKRVTFWISWRFCAMYWRLEELNFFDSQQPNKVSN